jgi:hypothetical protein
LLRKPGEPKLLVRKRRLNRPKLLGKRKFNVKQMNKLVGKRRLNRLKLLVRKQKDNAKHK